MYGVHPEREVTNPVLRSSQGGGPLLNAGSYCPRRYASSRTVPRYTALDLRLGLAQWRLNLDVSNSSETLPRGHVSKVCSFLPARVAPKHIKWVRGYVGTRA